MTSPANINTAYRLIRDAMEDAGLLQEGDEPSSEQNAKYLVRLYDLINFWQIQYGLKLWLQSDQSITLVAGTATYTLMPGGDVDITRPLRAPQGYYLDTSGNRRPIYPISREEYTRLPNTTTQGAINQYFVDKQYDRLSVSFWNVPNASEATGTAHLIIQRQMTNPISLTENLELPPEWMLAYRWGLADDICTGQPQAIMDRCAARALTYRTALEDWDVEDASTYVQPDAASGNRTGAFR